MYADRYQPNKLNRGSLTASVGIVGGLLTVALLSSPYVTGHIKDPGIRIYDVDPITPPPPDPVPPPKQAIQARSTPHLDQPKTVVQVPTPVQPYVAPPVVGPTIDLDSLAGSGTDIAPFDPPKPAPPVLVGAQADPRYARDFQPVYPAAEQRAGREGW